MDWPISGTLVGEIALVVRTSILLLAAAAGLCAQTAQLDSHKGLFTMMAALNAAGFDTDLESPSNHPLRKAIRAEIAKKKAESVHDLRAFFREHRQDSALQELRLYTSFALVTDGPPKFAWRLREHQLPPDVLSIKELAPILERFYKEAGIEDLWARSQPALDQALLPYHGPALQAIQLVSAYLRAPLSGTFGGRQFKVVVDLLGPPNQILFMPFFDDYNLVVTHSAEPHVNDVRSAYIQYLVDPMVTNNQDKIETKKALIDYVQNAPIASHYKEDFLLLLTRSLVRAIETQLERPASGRPGLVDRAMKEGFILTAHFAEQLPVYQKQEQSMRLYFPELIKSIDLAREERRLANFEFNKESTVRVARTAPVVEPPAPELSPAEKSLEAAEELYKARDLEKARGAFAAVLTQSDAKPVQARAYYGLARIATLRRDPETAEKLFLRAIELEPPAADKAWAQVYLGGLYQAQSRGLLKEGQADEAAREDTKAAEQFRAALRVEGASEKALEAARKGLADVSQRLPKQ